MVSGLSFMFEEERQKAEKKAYDEKIEMVREMLLDGEPMKKIIKYSKLIEQEIEDIKKIL